MNHFATILDIAEQRRQARADQLLPIAWQRQRIAALEGAPRDLIRAGDSLKIPTAEQNRWHTAALAAEAVLNSEDAAEWDQETRCASLE